MSVAARTSADDPVVVEIDDLRQRASAEGRRSRQEAAALAAAIVTALPALIEAARVVTDSGEWECREPVLRVGHGGGVAEMEPCGRCIGCRMTAAQDLLAEVEL